MFCVICFEDCDCLFRRRDKEIYSKCADPAIEKERVQRDKNGNMNMLHFMQLAHPRHMDINIQNSKHKGQNKEVTSFEHRTQNICIQNTVSHIGFRSARVAMFECSPFRYNNPILYRTLLPSNTATSLLL